MGIWNDAVCVYGLSIEYNEAIKFAESKEGREMADNIGCDNIRNLWSEYFGTVIFPYFDCPPADCKYILGELMPSVDTGWLTSSSISAPRMIEWLSKYETYDAELEAICSKFGFKFARPAFHCLPTVH